MKVNTSGLPVITGLNDDIFFFYFFIFIFIFERRKTILSHVMKNEIVPLDGRLKYLLLLQNGICTMQGNLQNLKRVVGIIGYT